jgi:uncharacterized membrane protein
MVLALAFIKIEDLSNAIYLLTIKIFLLSFGTFVSVYLMMKTELTTMPRQPTDDLIYKWVCSIQTYGH